MIGILTEKPFAAGKFAEALGGKSGVFEGEAYVIVNSFGHLYEFADVSKQVPAELSATYKAWSESNLPWDESKFSWKRVMKKDAGPAVRTICDTLSKCDEVVMGTDVDPSGEGFMLGAEILIENHIKPRKLTRMYFVDEEVPSIQKAFRERKVISSLESDPEYLKAMYRARFDFLSMQFTRIATLNGDGQSVLREGRLKSVMVDMVGAALAALKAYKKIPSYQNRFRDENGNLFVNDEEPVFPRKEQVPNQYQNATVVVDGTVRKKTAPGKLLDLAGLSARLSTKGFKAAEVQATYQKMYDARIVSYPRTEDKTITNGQFKELLPLVDKIAAVVGVDTGLLTHRTPRSTHVKDKGAHGANRPGPNVPVSLESLRSYGPSGPLIYEILAKNYLAMLAEDYEYDHQTGHLKEYPKFVGSANIPMVQGYKAVFSGEDEVEEGSPLGKTAEPFVHEGFPPKPPIPTMTWMMKNLDKYNVGTGATRNSTFAEVTNEKAKYPLILVDGKGKLSLTKYGEMSYLLLEGTHIGSVKLTEEVWENMHAIADGKLDGDSLLPGMQRLVMEDLAVMKKNGENMRKELGISMETAQPKEKYKGVWNGREISFTRVWGGHRFSDEECERLCNGEEIEIPIAGQDGKPYSVKGKLADQNYEGHAYVGFLKSAVDDPDRYSGVWKHGSSSDQISFKRVFRGYRFSDEECETLLSGGEVTVQGLKSSKGGTYGVYGKLAKQTYEGHSYVGFKQLGFADSDTPPKAFCGHTFTEDEIQMLLNGLTVHLDGCISRKGKEFSCDIVWGVGEDGKKKLNFVK